MNGSLTDWFIPGDRRNATEPTVVLRGEVNSILTTTR